MSIRSIEHLRRVAFAGVVAVWACSGGATSPSLATGDNSLVVVSVTPASYATNVDPSSPISIAFNRSMMAGMELLVMLHEGSVLGPEIAASSAWSPDRKVLTLVPSVRLKPKTTYVVHLSPNLRDVAGQGIQFALCAGYLRGRAPSGIGWMGGMMGGNGRGMMGAGWQPGSGTWAYGMFFTFITT